MWWAESHRPIAEGASLDHESAQQSGFFPSHCRNSRKALLTGWIPGQFLNKQQQQQTELTKKLYDKHKAPYWNNSQTLLLSVTSHFDFNKPFLPSRDEISYMHTPSPLTSLDTHIEGNEILIRHLFFWKVTSVSLGSSVFRINIHLTSDLPIVFVPNPHYVVKDVFPE